MDIEFQTYRGPDSVLLVWWHPERITGCLGYAVMRRVDGGDEVPLLAYVGFPVAGRDARPNEQGQPSTEWPFQRFTWTDFSPPAQGRVEYRVVAVAGSAKAPEQTEVTSDWVEPVVPRFGVRKPFFNFGIVGSRWFADKASDYPAEFDALKAALAPRHDAGGAPGPGPADQALQAVLALNVRKGDPTSPTIGAALGGPLAKQVEAMLDAAKDDQTIHLYMVLFELSDDDLVRRLLEIGNRCHLILANGTHEHGTDENARATQALEGRVDLHRRILRTPSVYAHNKFMVIVRRDKPQAAWTGSTNWTPHGLYTQVNNGLLVEDADVAGAYFDQWKKLEAAGDATPPPFLEGSQDQYHFDKDGVTTSVFFSPHRVPKSDRANSPDLKYAASLIRNARRGILTLMLDPGWTGSLLQDIRQRADDDPSLYVRGVVNTDPTIHAHQDDPTALGFLHGPEAIPSNYDIVLPGAQSDGDKPIVDFLGRVGIVVVHSKVVVIDPLGDHPVVMTGSHNAGVKAATINDDNLIIIENDRDLTLAYAINVISVFNHFWWRHNMAPPAKRRAAKADGAPVGGPARLTSAHEWKGLRTDDGWQDKFFAGDGEASEARFWGLRG